MENTPQQTSEGTAVVRVLATVLERLVKANADLSISGQITVTKFHALKAPGISIHQYLERVRNTTHTFELGYFSTSNNLSSFDYLCYS